MRNNRQFSTHPITVRKSARTAMQLRACDGYIKVANTATNGLGKLVETGGGIAIPINCVDETVAALIALRDRARLAGGGK